MPHTKKKKHGRHGKSKGGPKSPTSPASPGSSQSATSPLSPTSPQSPTSPESPTSPKSPATATSPVPVEKAQGGDVVPHSPPAAMEAESTRKTPTSTPAGLASTAKPAEFEKSATSATTAAAKGAATTAAAGAAPTASTAVKPGSPAATAAKGSPKTPPAASSKAEPAKTEPTKPAAGAGKAAKATENQGKPAEAKPGETSKTPPAASSKVEPAKTEPTKPAAGAGKAAKATENQGKPAEAKPGETSKGAPKSPAKATVAAGAAVKTAKPEDVKPKEMSKTKPSSPTKVDPTKSAATVVDGAAKAAGAAASKGKTSPAKPATGTEIQVEAATSAALKPPQEPDMDPFAALADSLPSEAMVPKEPVYTGPEVKEHDVTMEEGVLCGEDERTLPPGYRYEDMGKNIPPGGPEAKPEKPMSQDDALSALSLGFDSGPLPSAGKKDPKVEEVSALDALSAGFSKSAPPSSAQKKEEVVAASVSAAGPLKSAAPPADKKAKLGGDEFSLTSAVESPKPPADKKPKKDESPCPDAMSALGDLLPAAEPIPEPPKIRPEDEVKENKLKSEKAKKVGEREETLPPDYRFKEEELKKYPAPKPEPALGTDKALDILSGGFDTPAVAPTVQAGLPPSTRSTTKPEVEDVSALDALAGDFVAPTNASVVQASVPPATKPTKKTTPSTAGPTAPKPDESASLDAMSALGDLLPTAKPMPEPPKIRPEDQVKVDKLKSKKAEKEGEGDETLPPDYRFTEEELKKYPAPKPEPAMSTNDALDILGDGFGAPAVAPTVQAASPPIAVAPSQGKLAVCHGAPQLKTLPPSVKSTKKDEPDFSLDSAVEQVVAPTVASGVHSEPQLSGGAVDAMDALSNTLADITPAPAPAPVPVKDIVKEKKVVQERIIKMGERDDTLPPEFQPTEEERKEMEKMKAQEKSKADVCPAKKAADEAAALSLLSADFSSPSDSSAPAAPCVPCASAAPQTQSAAPTGGEMPSVKGPVLDALSETLVPNTKGFKSAPAPAPDKPKAKSGKSKSRSKKQAVMDPAAVDVLSADLGSDVVSTSPTKKSSKS